jgi:hypothetical protein
MAELKEPTPKKKYNVDPNQYRQFVEQQILEVNRARQELQRVATNASVVLCKYYKTTRVINNTVYGETNGAFFPIGTQEDPMYRALTENRNVPIESWYLELMNTGTYEAKSRAVHRKNLSHEEAARKRYQDYMDYCLNVERVSISVYMSRMREKYEAQKREERKKRRAAKAQTDSGIPVFKSDEDKEAFISAKALTLSTQMGLPYEKVRDILSAELPKLGKPSNKGEKK